MLLANGVIKDTLYIPENKVYQIKIQESWKLTYQDEGSAKFEKLQNPKGVFEIGCGQLCCGKINLEAEFLSNSKYDENSIRTKIGKYHVYIGEKNKTNPEKHWIYYYGKVQIWLTYFSYSDSIDKSEVESISEMIKTLKIKKKHYVKIKQ
jgi:hypothetical protein